MNIIKMCLALSFASLIQAATVTGQFFEQPDNTVKAILDIQLDNDEYIYDNMSISCDNPHITLSNPISNKQPEITYDPGYKKNVTCYTSSFTLETTASYTKQEPTLAHLHVIFFSNKSTRPNEAIIPFTFSFANTQNNTKKTASLVSDINDSQILPADKSSQKKHSLKELGNRLQNTLTTTDSWILRFIFAFLLGILMSLTPCIYPMIPITVGILQSQRSTSLLHNFLLSLAYTLGLATTFATLGFIAATSGSAFGHLMGNPIFVIALVAILGYFAFSMFGLYPLYIPRFLQKKQSLSQGRSFLSIFVFGLASGSVASPCLSPGLALILTMVASIANKMLGFGLLFLFGIGVSFPLLIIGTFSSSLNVLPRAGMWMLEIQKIFGFMLLGMCLYYLSAIIPTIIFQGLVAGFMICISVYYYYSIADYDTKTWKLLKMIFAIASGAAGIFSGIQLVQEYYYKKTVEDNTHWYTDFDAALVDAQRDNKKIMLDFWAPYCSVCKLITKHVLHAPEVNRVLEQKYIVVSVNGNDAQAEPYKTLRAQYNVQGFPDIIIIDANTQEELHRFKAELLDIDKQELIDILQK